MNFYTFDGAWKKDCLKIEPIVEYDTLSLLTLDCPIIRNPIFHIKQGKKLFDVIHFNNSQNIAISQRFKEILESNNFNGWSCFPIQIENIKESYYAFQNLSEAGPILNLEALNNYETEHTEFDLSTWNNYDIFHLKDTLLNVCAENVYRVLKKEKITNLELTTL